MMDKDERLRFRVCAQDRFALLGDGEIVIGRSPYCSLVLDHETLSRVHATLRVVGDRLVLTDERSSNGTFVNGARIDEPTTVGPGDDIRLGRLPLWIEAAPSRALMETGKLVVVVRTDPAEETLHGVRKPIDETRRDDEDPS